MKIPPRHRRVRPHPRPAGARLRVGATGRLPHATAARLVRLAETLPDPPLLTTDSELIIDRRHGRRVIHTRMHWDFRLHRISCHPILP